MPTFIWNTEYDVLIANAPTQYDATRKLKMKMGIALDDWLNEDSCNTQSVKEARSLTKIDQIEEYLKVLQKAPDTVLRDNEAVIYNHGNE